MSCVAPVRRRLAQKIYPASVPGTPGMATGDDATHPTSSVATTRADSSNSALLCFHGMLGTRRTWGAFAPAFAAGGVRFQRHVHGSTIMAGTTHNHHAAPSNSALSENANSQWAASRPLDVVCYDARNHGTSFHDATHSLSAIADDMAASLADVDAHVGAHAGTTNAPERKKKKIVLVGHSMCGAALLHFLLRREQRLHYSANTNNNNNEKTTMMAADPSLNLRYVELAGAVIVDISPSQRPSMFTTLARQIARLEQVPLSQMASTRDVEKWLLSKAPFPAPEPLTPHALGLDAFPNADLNAPFPIPGPFLAKYFAANLVQNDHHHHDHHHHGQSHVTGKTPHPSNQKLKWGCNLPVLSKAIRDGSISWEEQLALILSEVEENRSSAQQLPQQHQHGSVISTSTSSTAVLPQVTGLKRVESVPVHFVFGGASPYYLEVPNVRSNIDRYFARSTVDIVDKAGHFVHIERPKSFNESVAAFLDRSGAF